MVYTLFPDCGFRCKNTGQLIPVAGTLVLPAGSLQADDAKQRFAHGDYNPKPQETGSEQARRWKERRVGWGGVGGWELFQSWGVFRSCGFNRRVTAFTQAREAQIYKHHPKKHLVRKWKSAEVKVDGGSGGCTTHPDHGGWGWRLIALTSVVLAWSKFRVFKSLSVSYSSDQCDKRPITPTIWPVFKTTISSKIRRVREQL